MGASGLIGHEPGRQPVAQLHTLGLRRTLPMSALVGDLIGVLAQTISIYTLILLVRVLLSWFPNLDWGNPVLSTVSAVTDPYLNAFRGLIPPLGGLDLSAILAFLALQLIQTLLEQSRGFFYPSFY